jgi:ribosomal-protein-alanine N-acetyltransferase
MNTMSTGGREPADGRRRLGETVPGVVLRHAMAADAERIAEIERAAFTDPWSRRSFEALLQDRRVFFTVATVDDAIVAGYVVAWFAADEGEIANLAVAPAARRRHLGAALLDATIRAARARHVSSLYLEVRDSNTAARALYASRGFNEVGRRRAYYRRPVEDALVLRLVLPEG